MLVLGEDMIRVMKQNETINVLFLFFCMLLLGFVYVNTRMNAGFHQKAKTENVKSQSAQPEQGTPKNY